MNFVVDQTDRLDRFLARMLPEHSRSKLARIVDAGEVSVDGQTQKPSFTLSAGMIVALEAPGETAPHDLSPADIPLEIVFEDDSLLVVSKPRGLATHPATSLKEPSLVNALLARNTPLSQIGEEFRPGIVHRLDRETTGLMVVAKTDAAHVSLARQIESKSAERRYVAVVAGHVDREHFTIDAPMGRDKRHRILMAVDPTGKRAVTHIKRVAPVDAGTVVAARLETGRTHQIRVHLSAVGMPILGDNLYAPREFRTVPLQLHAAYLAFDHPVTGVRAAYYADPDASFIGREHVNRNVVEEW